MLISWSKSKSRDRFLEGALALVEPIIVVLGPRCGGTSAVAGVLHHLGVFMGSECLWIYRGTHESWEDRRLSLLCGHALRAPGDQLQMDPGYFEAKLRGWADEHRRAARIAGGRPGAKDPLLCVAVDFIRAAWNPVVPVVVDRPPEKIVASLNRWGWLRNEQERIESTAHLIAARDRALAGATTIRVDFEELRATPAVAVGRLADELGLKVTESQKEAAVQSILRPADVRRDADPYGIDLLLAKVERRPHDWWGVSLLATAYFDSGDFVSARNWYARQVEIGGPGEEIWFALWRVAESMARLDMPWPDVQDAYLRAWDFRPIRAEPLYAIARRHRMEERYHLGYLFAKRAAQIPLPEDEIVFGRLDSRKIYSWQSTEEQALCGLRLGKHAEAFALCRRLLARPDIPDDDRQRIANNRDVSVPAMIAAAASYPDASIGSLVAGPPDAEVTVSLVAGPDLTATEQTLNSFLRCCTDVSRVGRFLVADAGLGAVGRRMLCEGYRFVEFADSDPAGAPGAQLAAIRAQINGRFWLHLGEGWRFFAPEDLITRLTAVLRAEPHVFQVGINLADAARLTRACAPEHAVRRAGGTGRYVIADGVVSGPAMFDTARLDRAGGVRGADADPLAELARRAAAAGLRTASLDEVLCITAT